MMRVVFLLFAEERRLLPSDDDLYAAATSVGRLVEQLEQRAAVAGEQTLEHRTGAWHRLLAVARALHQGSLTKTSVCPPTAAACSTPTATPGSRAAHPAHRSGVAASRRRPHRAADARAPSSTSPSAANDARLTFRALDVEQIGYVYEGLLELEVRTAEEVILGLTRPAKWPRGKRENACEVSVSQVSSWLEQGPAEVKQQLKARTGKTTGKVEQGLRRDLDDYERSRISAGMQGNDALLAVLPIAAFLRFDERGQPAITLTGRRYIAPNSRRAATGTYYTPRSLAEDVVNNTLEPLVYRPGPLQDRRSRRVADPASTEILELRIADIAMGSGAFLVAACRYLADRLIEAWDCRRQARRRPRCTSTRVE